MEKHFCTCVVTECPNHPRNSSNGCDACIQKNLKLGEIPCCFWNNKVVGETQYSATNFAKHILKNKDTGYSSEYADVTYLDDLNVVFVKWKKFCRQDDYRNPLLYAIDVMRSHLNCHYVADTRDGFENEDADTKWVFDEFLPQTAATTCKAIFFIIDNNNTLKAELEGQSVELKKQFDVHYCFGIDEVRALLTQYSMIKEP